MSFLNESTPNPTFYREHEKELSQYFDEAVIDILGGIAKNYSSKLQHISEKPNIFQINLKNSYIRIELGTSTMIMPFMFIFSKTTDYLSQDFFKAWPQFKGHGIPVSYLLRVMNIEPEFSNRIKPWKEYLESKDDIYNEVERWKEIIVNYFKPILMDEPFSWKEITDNMLKKRVEQKKQMTEYMRRKLKGEILPEPDNFWLI